MANMKKCISCKNLIENKCKRCWPCYKKHATGKNHSSYKHGKTLKIIYCLDCKKQLSKNAYYFKYKRCNACAQKIETTKKWKDISYRNKTTKAQRLGLNVSKNKKETILEEMLGKDYKFVGDGKVIINGFNPDFINCNGQKKIIELYGDYWHNLPKSKEQHKRRIKSYNKYGYKTLIVWEKELKDKEKLIKKIEEFV